MKRSGFQPRRSSLSRVPLRRPPRVPAPDKLQAARAAWKAHAQAGRCAMCGTGIHVTGHHVLPLGDLKTNGVPGDAWYDVRNQLRLCMEPSPHRCHQRHEHWVRRVPRATIVRHAPEAIVFAEEHDLGWLLDREYPA